MFTLLEHILLSITVISILFCFIIGLITRSFKLTIVTLIMTPPLLALSVAHYLFINNFRLNTDNMQIVSISSNQHNYERNITVIENGKAYEVEVPVLSYYKPNEPTNNIIYNSSMDRVISTNESVLRDRLNSIINSTERYDDRDAYITEDIKFIDEVNTNKVELEKLLSDIIINVESNNTYDLTKYYTKPVHAVQSKDVNDLYNKIISTAVSYTNKQSISLMDCNPSYSISTNTVSFNMTSLSKQVTDITLGYDNVGRDTFTFTTYYGDDIPIKSGTWGSITDTEKEIDFVTEAFLNLNSYANRIPEMKQYFPDTLPNTYIEVDKGTQEVFVFENGVVTMSSNCVTGLPPKRSTPSGVYYVSELVKEKTLRGPGYTSHVHRWMRLTNQGIGLHDATWRSKFGGNIYKRDGSHGCINLPKEFAYNLYDFCLNNKNICVVVHD